MQFHTSYIEKRGERNLYKLANYKGFLFLLFLIFGVFFLEHSLKFVLSFKFFHLFSTKKIQEPFRKNHISWLI